MSEEMRDEQVRQAYIGEGSKASTAIMVMRQRARHLFLVQHSIAKTNSMGGKQCL